MKYINLHHPFTTALLVARLPVMARMKLIIRNEFHRPVVYFYAITFQK